MSSYSALVLAHGSLKAYYRLGEGSGTTLTDSGPNGLTGTYAGSGITYGVAGAIANDASTAVTFVGSSDAATVPDNNALDLADAFSLECWVKRSATQGTNQCLIAKSATAEYVLRFQASNRAELLKFGTGGAIVSSSVITDTASWHHLVVTKNAGARVFYVDGVDVTVLGTNQTLASSTGILRLGHVAAATDRYTGSLDEVAIYNAVLTPEEVLQHYRTGRAQIALTDAVVSSESRGASPGGARTDSVTATDSRTSASGKAQADSVTPTDAATKAPGKSLTDAATASDATTRTPGKGLADSVAPADARSSAVGKTQADSVTSSDATLRTPGKGLADSVTASDSRTSAPRAVQSDIASVSDALTTAEGNFVVLGDAVTVSDQISPDLLQDFIESVADSVTVSDAVVLMASSASGTQPTTGGAVMVPVIRRVTVESHRLHFNDPVFLTDDLSTDRRSPDRGEVPLYVEAPQRHRFALADIVRMQDGYEAIAEPDLRLREEEELILALL